MKKILAVALVPMLLLIAGCTEDEKAPETPVEKHLDRLTSGLADGKLLQTNEIPGEDGLTLINEYSTDYDVKSWRITDSKTLRFAVTLKDEYPKTTVLIEHVHVDVNLDARRAGIDGIPQDSMDDSLHTGTEPGFQVTKRYPYEEVFSIEGFSETLISGWGYATRDYGTSSLSETRLSEHTLRHDGKCQGNKFTFIYDVLIKREGDAAFHKRVVVDEFIIPVG